MDNASLFTPVYRFLFFAPRGGCASSAASPPAVWAAEGTVWESPVGFAVGEAHPEPVHPPAESHVLCFVTPALPVGQHSVVQHCGGQAIRVREWVWRVFLSCLSLFVNSHHATSNECNHVLQPEGCVKVFIIKRRDSGSRCGHLSDRLPSLLACFHAVQNEPQQGNPNLTKCDIWSSFLVFQRPWIKQNISSVIVYL